MRVSIVLLLWNIGYIQILSIFGSLKAFNKEKKMQLEEVGWKLLEGRKERKQGRKGDLGCDLSNLYPIQIY